MKKFNSELHEASELTGQVLCYLTDDAEDIRADFFNCSLQERHATECSGEPGYRVKDEVALVIGSEATQEQVLRALNGFFDAISVYGLASVPDLLIASGTLDDADDADVSDY